MNIGHLAAVKELAEFLLAERHRDPVGQNWAANFVKRQPELKVKFNRKYDYKRALCEDPEVIRGWLKLVENTKTKYGIQDEDTYNFASCYETPYSPYCKPIFGSLHNTNVEYCDLYRSGH
jgi:hypothetical protein